MNISESNHKRGKDGRKGKRIILDKEGGLRTAEEYESISLEPTAYNIGGLPYFAKISEIRGIIYRAEGICNRKPYRAWRNMR